MLALTTFLDDPFFSGIDNSCETGKHRTMSKKQQPNLVVIHGPVNPEAEESDGGYRATDLQKRFRETVAQCVAEQTILTFDGWRAQHMVRTKDNVTRRQWDRWNDNQSFKDWFASAMPGEPSEMEIAIARRVARRKLIERIGSDDVSVARTAMIDLDKMDPSAPAKGAGASPTKGATRAGVLARVRGK